MQGEMLPLFPLNVVLFPSAALPLHIFEERYKEMIGEAIRDHSEFGVVLAREGSIVNVGCTATVEEVTKRYPDGRLDIHSVGRRRFEILLLNEEKAYLRAPVQFFDDDEPGPAPPEVVERAVGIWRTLLAVEGVADADAPEPGGLYVSFQLVQFVPDLDFRQMLLGVRSEVDRLQRLIEFLSAYVPKQRLIAHAKTVAPRNGRGRHPVSLADAP